MASAIMVNMSFSNWHEIPSLPALRAFEAAARHGSFSAAARDLNVTHAAIGQHVRALEDYYGQSLMHREGRGMTTTAEGHRLATALTEAFDQIASASADLMRQTAARALRVAVTPSFAANWLMPRIGHFWETHPEIELEIIPSMALVEQDRLSCRFVRAAVAARWQTIRGTVLACRKWR